MTVGYSLRRFGRSQTPEHSRQLCSFALHDLPTKMVDSHQEWSTLASILRVKHTSRTPGRAQCLKLVTLCWRMIWICGCIFRATHYSLWMYFQSHPLLRLVDRWTKPSADYMGSAEALCDLADASRLTPPWPPPSMIIDERAEVRC